MVGLYFPALLSTSGIIHIYDRGEKLCPHHVSNQNMYFSLVCVILGAFGIDRSYSYSASLGKYYNKGTRFDLNALVFV